MKHILLLIMILCTLCSCTVSLEQNPYSDSPIPESDSSDSAQTVEISEAAPVYTRVYDIQMLSDALTWSSKPIIREDGIWLFSAETKDKQPTPRLDRYSYTGEHQDTVYPPLPDDIRDGTVFAESVRIAYPLENGGWFTLYLLTKDQMRWADYAAAYIQAPDGSVEYQLILEGALFDAVSDHQYAVNETDGHMQFLVYTADRLYYYNETLEVGGTYAPIDGIPFGSLYHVGGDVWRSGSAWANTEQLVIDLSSGSVRRSRRSVPDGYDAAVFLQGFDGNTYLLETEGVSLYDSSGGLHSVLLWAESGILHNNLFTDGAEAFFVIDETRMLYKVKTSVNGRTSYAVHLVRIAEQEQTEEMRIISVSAAAEGQEAEWLNAAISAFNRGQNTYRAVLNLIGRDQIPNILLYDNTCDVLIADCLSTLSEHYDKHAFSDLSWAEECLLGGIYDSFVSEDGALYSFPLSISLTALAASSDVVRDTALTWEDLYSYRSTLDDGAYLLAPSGMGSGSIVKSMYRSAISDFINEKEARSSFDSDAFRDTVEFLSWLEDSLEPGIGSIQFSPTADKITNGTLPRRLREGGVLFAEVQISDLLHFSLLDRIFEGDDYVLCGLPSSDGGYVLNHSASLFPVILNNTDESTGAAAFLAYLLSDEMQSHEAHFRLPVTESAVRAGLDNITYQYYHTEDLEMLAQGIGTEIHVTGIGASAELVEDWGQSGFYTYETVSFSDADKQEIRDFLRAMRMRTDTDQTVLEIVSEELSYWQNNARSLEETTKIIDSRVWIYLNE